MIYGPKDQHSTFNACALCARLFERGGTFFLPLYELCWYQRKIKNISAGHGRNIMIVGQKNTLTKNHPHLPDGVCETKITSSLSSLEIITMLLWIRLRNLRLKVVSAARTFGFCQHFFNFHSCTGLWVYTQLLLCRHWGFGQLYELKRFSGSR